jgi:hypothetical protein
MCKIGIHFLFNRIREPDIERQISNIEMKLVIRESSGPEAEI